MVTCASSSASLDGELETEARPPCRAAAASCWLAAGVPAAGLAAEEWHALPVGDVTPGPCCAGPSGCLLGDPAGVACPDRCPVLCALTAREGDEMGRRCCARSAASSSSDSAPSRPRPALALLPLSAPGDLGNDRLGYRSGGPNRRCELSQVLELCSQPHKLQQQSGQGVLGWDLSMPGSLWGEWPKLRDCNGATIDARQC